MNILEKIIIYFTSVILTLSPTPKYTEGIVGQPQNFLPSQAQTPNDRTISRMIFRGLFKYDNYGALQPDLADTWSISPDGLVYTIKLKENNFWTNGKRITSDDLIYTSFKVNDLSGVATDKEDELTVRYTLPNRYAPFLNLMTVGIMPSQSEEKVDPIFPVSSGPFRVISVEKVGGLVKKVTLHNSETNLRKLVFRYYKTEDDLNLAIKLAEIDGYTSEAENPNENFEDHKFPLQGVYYALFFNQRNEKFQDPALRINIAKALNTNHVIGNKGIPVEGPISRSAFTSSKLKFNIYDENFSIDMSTKDFKLTIPDLPIHRDSAQLIKSLLKDKLGIKVEIIAVQPENFIKEIVEPRNFEVLLYGQEVSRDPDRYVLWHSEQKDPPGLNITGFKHVRADRALEEGRKELETSKRTLHYEEFERVFSEQVPAIFLYHPFVHHYVTSHIKGIGEKYTYTYVDRFLDFYNWTRLDTN